MIETIVKRNGEKEDFSPSKVNQWGEWASKTLGTKVDWSSVVLHTVSTLPKECQSQLLQERLIKTCLEYNSWSYNRMAGRLYAALIYKTLYDDEIPTVKELHHKLQKLGLMEHLSYTDEEYDMVEKIIDHSKDLKATHFELKQVREKYSLRNRVTGEEYESQQFVYMRMAMALAEDQPEDRRMTDLAAWYELFSNKVINAPTPNYVNLGTPLRGFASCCLYTTNDNARSIGIGDHIAYTMTYMSAGIGAHHKIRSLGDPVRGGVIKHQGKLPYYRALVGAIKANLQNGRGGAATTYYSMFDPEVDVISQLKNPMSTEDKKIRGMDYNAGTNKFYARKAAKNEKVFLFNCFTAPDLYKAFYSDDEELFANLYEKYEKDDNFKKKYVNARDALITVLNEGYETGRAYLHWIDEMNRHTPFYESIHSSNLCAEISLPTKGYDSMADLYSTEDHGRGEIALCSLGGIVVSNVKDDEEYEKACYYALLMIDKCIHRTHYELPHLGVTAKSRLNAGVGIIGLAHHMAKLGLSYSSDEGKQEIHDVAEKHMYYLIKSSLKLGKELGNAPWMHKTKWPEGWLPIDTYNKNVDTVVKNDLHYDWEELRREIMIQGGIRNSVVCAHMPSESSSKASGTTNGVYPVRDIAMLKSDNSIIINWCAPDGEKLAKKYDIAWDVPTKDMIDAYAIIQKWTDQAISADLYRRLVGDEVVGSKEMLTDYFYMTKMGIKTRYYVNSKTSDGVELGNDGAACGSGGCTL
ncbi:MAG: ribonucleoside-diphosphate reductase subunit alpha [Nitrosopumilaceae archaeon]|nr:ribonucleoside-diphosphate reductase subunit alpha [Nitrosopumilaceae archaeon]